MLPRAGGVTRARPKTDWIACAWLIRRFIDPDADILYVASMVPAAACLSGSWRWVGEVGWADTQSRE